MPTTTAPAWTAAIPCRRRSISAGQLSNSTQPATLTAAAGTSQCIPGETGHNIWYQWISGPSSSGAYYFWAVAKNSGGIGWRPMCRRPPSRSPEKQGRKVPHGEAGESTEGHGETMSLGRPLAGPEERNALRAKRHYLPPWPSADSPTSPCGTFLFPASRTPQ